jgi:hypothetical protein
MLQPSLFDVRPLPWFPLPVVKSIPMPAKSKKSIAVKPLYDQIRDGLNEMAAQPKESPIEIVVRENYDAILKAIENGYSYSEICLFLKSKGVAGAYPKGLGSALKQVQSDEDKHPTLKQSVSKKAASSTKQGQADLETLKAAY